MSMLIACQCPAQSKDLSLSLCHVMKAVPDRPDRIISNDTKDGI